ncbi:MAG: hypothetical protein IPJ65_14355 [Archangiaceae bacterium]|nr:hypothetical protein [Archangiaceae bacterium]
MAGVPLPGRFKPDAALALPKAGVFAERQGELVAAQIAAAVLGKKESAGFDGTGFCYIEVGDGKAVRGEGDFFAMPNPKMTPRGQPDAAQLDDKRTWVRRFLDSNLATAR